MDKPFTENRATPSTVWCRMKLQEANDSFVAAHWYGNDAPKHPVPNWHEKYHFRCGVDALAEAALALGYTLTKISPDAATGKDGGPTKDDEKISVGGGVSPTQSPCPAAVADEVAS